MSPVLPHPSASHLPSPGPLPASRLLPSCSWGLGLLLVGGLACSDQKASALPDGGLENIGAVGGGGGHSSDAAADLGTNCVAANPACDSDSDSDPIEPGAVISDFESGSQNIPIRDGRMGSWWTAGDATTGAILSPKGAAPPETIPGGRCGSQKALHVTGAGFLDWGSTLGLTTNWGPNDAGISEPRPWDGSAYKGLTFWARIGDTSGAVVRLGVSDQFARPEAGLCVIDGPPGKACYDTFGTDLPGLDTQWKRYKISFASLEQRGFGILTPKLDTTQIYQIELAMAPGQIFDFWLDDVKLY